MADTALAVQSRTTCAWTYEYDPDENANEYSLSLLSAEGRAQAAAARPLTIGDIRSLVSRETVKESQEARGETYAVDADLIHLIDVGSRFPVFIEGDSVHTREELCAIYPFEALRTTPEAVFTQQELGYFAPSDTNSDADLFARDLGDPEPFMRVRDLVRLACHGETAAPAESPNRIVKTKVFLGKVRWKRFLESHKLFGVINDFVRPALNGGSLFQLANAVAGDSPTLRLGDGRGAAPILALTAGARGPDAERVGDEEGAAGPSAAREETLGFRDEAMRAREETMKIREETLGFRDEAMRARDEALSARAEALSARDKAMRARAEALRVREAQLDARDSLGALDELGELEF